MRKIINRLLTGSCHVFLYQFLLFLNYMTDKEFGGFGDDLTLQIVWEQYDLRKGLFCSHKNNICFHLDEIYE